MASRAESPERLPVMLLLTDRTLKPRVAYGPSAVAATLKAAKANETPVDRLPWTPVRTVHAAFTAALAGKRKSLSWRLDGVEFQGQVVPVPGAGGEPDGVLLTGVSMLAADDRAELHDLRQALRIAQEATSSAYYVADLSTDIVTITPSFARIWGLPESTREVSFAELAERVHERDRETFTSARNEAIAANAALRVQFRVVRAPGDVRYVRIVGGFFTDARGNIQRNVGTIVDVTDQIQAQHAVSFLTKRDPLTGLLNRQVLIQLLHERANVDDDLALMLVDIDRFGQINEIAGHAVGDQLLRAVADRLSALERHGHVVSRLGGDEFACLLVDMHDDLETERLLRGIHQHLATPYTIGDGEYLLRTTAGVARAPQDGRGVELLQSAGMALVDAKTTARGSMARYDAALETRLSARSRLERDLAGAVDRRQFAMYYQPVIDANSGAVCAAEALLRWRHPDLGILTPDVFLGIAEETDLVVSIGRWVIDRACRDAVRMRAQLRRPFRLNVNVSPRQVQSSALYGDVCDALERSGWFSRDLQLEVTEQMLIQDVPSAASMLARLQNDGVTIAIDDFGTGYNTLSYLKSYPVNCIKIDRAFVRDAENDDYSRAICRSVKTLAESLNMLLIGEGVETPAQALFLRTIGCNELQGYHFGYPAPVDDFIAAYAAAS